MTAETAGATPPSDFTFAVPDDWVRIRTDDPAARSADVRSLTGRLTRGRPDRDTLAPQVARMLEQVTTEQVGEHTVEVYLSLLLSGRLPVVCSLAVDVVPPQAAPGDDGHLVAAFLATAGADGTGEVAELVAGPVPRVRRRRPAQAPDGTRVETAVVQYQHLVPGGGYLLLSFSTPQLQLLEPLGAVFDAVAGSLRWLL